MTIVLINAALGVVCFVVGFALGRFDRGRR
jgi:hypothetical protein